MKDKRKTKSTVCELDTQTLGEGTRRITSEYIYTAQYSYERYCYDLKLELRLHLGKNLRES